MSYKLLLAVLKKLLNQNINVKGLSRCEQKQRLIRPHKNLKLFLGDVRDPSSLHKLIEGCDYVFHFAALKCVDTLEDNPEEAYKTNTLGTWNVSDICYNYGVKKMTFISTDKACKPITAYGKSKAAGEDLVSRYPQNCIFAVFSIVPLFNFHIDFGNAVIFSNSYFLAVRSHLIKHSCYIIAISSN